MCARVCAHVTHAYTYIGKIDVHTHTHTHACAMRPTEEFVEYSKRVSASVCTNKESLLNLCDKMNLVNNIIYSTIQFLFITGKKNPIACQTVTGRRPGPRVRGGGGSEGCLQIHALPALVTKTDLSLQLPGARLPNRNVDRYL